MPDFPQVRDFATVLYLALASSLGWVGGWLTRRKREPAEISKIHAEARQITVSTDISLTQAATQAATSAIVKAERLQQQCDHWQLKAFDLQVEVKELKTENGQLKAQAFLDNHHIRKLMAFIEARELKEDYLVLDKPKEESPS